MPVFFWLTYMIDKISIPIFLPSFSVHLTVQNLCVFHLLSLFEIIFPTQLKKNERVAE